MVEIGSNHKRKIGRCDYYWAAAEWAISSSLGTHNIHYSQRKLSIDDGKRPTVSIRHTVQAVKIVWQRFGCFLKKNP